MKRRRWVFGAVVLAGVAVLVAPAVGQGSSRVISLRWSGSTGPGNLASYDFGEVKNGSSASKGFRLWNSAVTRSGTLDVSLAGSPAFSITINRCKRKSIGPTLSCWVGVAYAPLALSTSATATLKVVGEDGGLATLDLSGSNAGGPSGHVYWGSFSNDGPTVREVPRGGGNAVTLAVAHVSDVVSMATDGANVYWLNYVTGSDHSGTVEEMPLGGGKVTTLATGQNWPIALAVDGTSVYWVTWETQGTVNKVPIGGGPVTTLATGQSGPVSVATDGSHVFWVNHGDGTVNEVPVGGGPVTTLATGQSGPLSVAVDGTDVYWTNDGNGTVNEVPLGGGSVTTLAHGLYMPTSVAVDGTHAYWVDIVGESVSSVSLAGGSVTTLAQSPGRPYSLAVDGTHVYWVGDGFVAKVPVGGGGSTILARGNWLSDAVAIGP